jgi:hypothetical protein
LKKEITGVLVLLDVSMYPYLSLLTDVSIQDTKKLPLTKTGRLKEQNYRASKQN